MIAFAGDAERKRRLLSTAVEQPAAVRPDLARHGYPAALAALLDAMMELIGTPEEAAAFGRSRITAVAPGADLAPVATLAMLHLLAADEWRRWRPDMIEEITRCHRAGLAGADPDWQALREGVISASETARSEREAMIAAGWEAACWPATEGRSVLVSIFNAWWAIIRADDFSEDVDTASRCVLEGLWDEQQPARDAGRTPDYPALFRARAPDLSAAYERNLARDNAYRRACLTAFAAHLLELLAEASPR